MTQNPYAQQPGFEQVPVATRTSIAAILSLICALLCPIPGLGVIAIILGIAALFMISSSNGRVTGKGLAISGVFIGLLATLLWVGAFFFMKQVGNMLNQQFMGNTTAVFQAIEAKNYSNAKTLLNTPSNAPQPTDADFDAFLAAYQAEVGSFQSMPKGLLEWIGSFGKLQNFNMQAQPGHIPIPGEFSNGTAIVLLEVPQGFNPGSSPNANSMPVLNLGIQSLNGKSIWLIPKATGTNPGTPSNPPPAPAPSPVPAGGNGG